jgi:8-oxo-dGTP pyrophosphatase MutT (NUDIX family)
MTISDQRAPRFPVSVKGVVFIGSRVVLLKNERDEWELPGGKLEAGEDPRDCLRREIQEELSLEATVKSPLDSWLYNIQNKVEVLIVTYGCAAGRGRKIVLSPEHKEVRLFSLRELRSLRMPSGYLRSIRHWARVR